MVACFKSVAFFFLVGALLKLVSGRGDEMRKVEKKGKYGVLLVDSWWVLNFYVYNLLNKLYKNAINK